MADHGEMLGGLAKRDAHHFSPAVTLSHPGLIKTCYNCLMSPSYG